jgi:hypothetical protein
MKNQYYHPYSSLSKWPTDIDNNESTSYSKLKEWQYQEGENHEEKIGSNNKKMALYIDESSVLNLCKTTLSKDCFSTKRQILFSQLDVHYNFPKIHLKPIQRNGQSSNWNDRARILTTYFTNGQGNMNYTYDFTEDTSTIFPKRPISKDMFQNGNFSLLSSVFLVDDTNLIEVKSSGRIIIGKSGEEGEVMEQLIINENPGQFFTKRIDLTNIKIFQWSNLKKYICPCSDIIISDRYLQKNNTNSFFHLIDTLVARCKSEINLVIFTYCNCTIKRNDIITIRDISNNSFQEIQEIKNKGEDVNHGDWFWYKMYCSLKKRIANITNSNCNVTFIFSKDNKANQHQNIENSNSDLKQDHDRIIITNYRSIDLKDSITNYESKDGSKKTTSYNILINSLACYDNYNSALSIIHTLQEKINISIKNNLIRGDYKSNFLFFSK